MMHARNYSSTKKLAYWGAGLVCKSCLEYRTEYRPKLIIDQNPKGAILGVDVINPSQIKDWKELFVVITTLYAGEVKNRLLSFGLKEGEDFAFYRNFFGTANDVLSSTSAMSEYMGCHPGCLGGTLLYTPAFSCRQKEIMTGFFAAYRKAHEEEPFVFISNLDGLPEDTASMKVGAKVFDLADCSRWDGTATRYEMCRASFDSLMNASFELDGGETQFTRDIEDIKTAFDKKASLELSLGLCAYIKKIFSVFSPGRIIIWGGESRFSLLLGKIAEKNDIPYGFMEHGWLSGTYQFDSRGTSGASEYAATPSVLTSKPLKNASLNIQKIKDYITGTGLDSGGALFKQSLDDSLQLEKLDSTKKTVFFVGMGDVQFNPQSRYWKDYVSPSVKSNEDAFLHIKRICEENNWNFIYKPHPHARSKMEDDSFRGDKSVAYITDMAIDSLIEMSDIVVSIRSAVDYKALVFSKPLVSLGRTTLQGQNIVYEVKEIDQLKAQMEEAMKNGITNAQKRNFDLHLHRLLENYLWDDLSHRDFGYGLSLATDFPFRTGHKTQGL